MGWMESESLVDDISRRAPRCDVQYYYEWKSYTKSPQGSIWLQNLEQRPVVLADQIEGAGGHEQIGPENLFTDQESLFFLIVIRVHSINTDVFTFCYLADAEDVVMELNEENEEKSEDKRYNHGLEPGSCVRCLKSIGNVPLCVPARFK
ncbi:hypothetical protein I7I51_06755 [Histoplasma capsulatum]|uniref:Uncharacterized protein n=1 Tax=Ajellomyces capsulatus TaxID=5037 RepID=A0A8A1MMI6_AJECA|nr:hypothetical protein I7I51_06755 [Histoplasma capsulatum]